jgi:cobalamin-dependent methionine synthase I
LADRFAEALPNIYEKVRKEIWGYAADEVLVLTNDCRNL